MSVTCLVIGDIVGKPGRGVVRAKLGRLCGDEGVDVVIANAENAAGGSGLTPELARKLLSSGIHCITLGDHCLKRAEIIPALAERSDIIRPLNLPHEVAGRGWTVVTTDSGVKVGVLCALGRLFMKPSDCPFHAIDAALAAMPEDVKVRILDFHAEATSEKKAMGWHLDGRVSALVGTHTHVPTSDECVLPEGTAYITDIGMTGPHDSVLGRRKDRVVPVMITGVPAHFDVAKDDVRLQGALIRIDVETGKAADIRRIEVKADGARPPAEEGDEATNQEE